jgi:hypothetical protein
VGRTRSLLDDLVPELRSLYDGPQFKPRMRLYEGAEGIKRAFRETLDCRSKLLLGILSMHELLEVPGPEWMAQYIDERILRGIKLTVVRSPARDKEAIWPSTEDEDPEPRYARGHLILGMTMYIYGDKLLHISSCSENYALVIESEEISTTNRSLFGALWMIGNVEHSPKKRDLICWSKVDITKQSEDRLAALGAGRTVVTCLIILAGRTTSPETLAA